ncbi:MAG: NfeD family protein [Candidatus Kapaibacterium sp.]
MRTLNIISVHLLSLIGLLLIPATGWGQSGGVYVLEISGDVDLGMAHYARRVFADAAEHHARAIVLHINTFGGRIDVATEIRDAALASSVPVIAYVDRRAISAGAMIALSARKIVMAPGGSIGAATPVYSNGERASEKVVSYMRGEMRSTAERNGRNPQLAEAMVDENLSIDDSTLKKSGELLTMTTDEAARVGYCDLVAPTLNEALAKLGYGSAPVIQTGSAWGETLVNVLTHPAINALLIMLGLGGIFFTIKTGHPSVISGIGLFAIALFFGAQYVADLATYVEVLIFVAGVLLLMLEIFVIPGFGVVGVLGILLIFGGLFLALVGGFNGISYQSLAVPLYTMIASLLGLFILIALMIKYLPASRTFSRFVLVSPATSSDAILAGVDYQRLVGHTGAALTTLRPSGVAQLDGDRFDVVSDGSFIQAGESVRVVKVTGRNIVVRRADEKG